MHGARVAHHVEVVQAEHQVDNAKEVRYGRESMSAGTGTIATHV